MVKKDKSLSESLSYSTGTRAKRNNLVIRKALADSGMKQWQLAELLNMREDKLSRLMRHELPADQQKSICAVIREAANE